MNIIEKMQFSIQQWAWARRWRGGYWQLWHVPASGGSLWFKTDTSPERQLEFNVPVPAPIGVVDGTLLAYECYPRKLDK